MAGSKCTGPSKKGAKGQSPYGRKGINGARTGTKKGK